MNTTPRTRKHDGYLRLALGTSVISAAFLASGCMSDPTLDEALAPPDTSVLEGTALLLYPFEPTHPVILFLTALDPTTYAPASVPSDITVIPSGSLVASQAMSEEMPQVPASRSGMYQFPLVEPGLYVITGFVDMDDNFNPFTSTGPTSGDVLGGYIDPTTFQPIPVLVGEGEIISQINPLFVPM